MRRKVLTKKNVRDPNLINFTFSATAPEIWRLQQLSMMEGRDVGRTRYDGFQELWQSTRGVEDDQRGRDTWTGEDGKEDGF